MTPAREVRRAYTGAQLAAVVDIADMALAPDGRTLAFASDRSGAFELFTLDLTATNVVPMQRTHASERVSGLVWSPDASALVFEMDHGGDERTDLYVLRRGADAPEPLTHSDTAEHAARFSPDGTQLAFESDPERPFRFNISVRDAAGHIAPLTHEPINVTQPRWSRDGRSLVATRSGDDQRGDLLVLDPSSLSQRVIAAPRTDGIIYAVDPLPDGHMLAIATNAAGFAQLATVDLVAGTSVFVGLGDWDIEAADVASEGSVVFSRNVHGESEVSFAPGGNFASIRTLARGGVVSAISVDRDAHTVALVREESNHPPEIVTIDTASGRETVRVRADVAGVRVEQLARARRHTFRSFDGREIDAFIWSPPISRLGSPPPLIMHVHGGPNGQTRSAFSPTVQSLVEAGFVVASVNYRGSTGYGRAFEDLNNRDWGGGDLRDIVDVVNALAAVGEIDRNRVGIYGGSYGGYMTLRAVTAMPQVWNAAVEMYGMPDLAEDYRLTADRFGTWYETEMGDPVRDAALYRDRSPIHALDQVRAPLMVLQGANDTNVPRTESDALVQALRARGRTVEYVVYPDEGHGFTHRAHRIDAIERSVAFFVRAIGVPGH